MPLEDLVPQETEFFFFKEIHNVFTVADEIVYTIDLIYILL